jgi:glyoxylase-like metal-dependent hydrolase (beta-lactamase superfamily II)
MTIVKQFVFNPYQVNTYVISDETKECIIVDGACSGQDEFNKLNDYIKSEGLKPVLLVNTHAHIDHIIGNYTICNAYNIPLAAHEWCTGFLTHAKIYAQTFGIEMEAVKQTDKYLTEETPVIFGNTTLKVLDTPGHADCSVCFYNEKDRYVITGDVLFKQSIGRTDLKTGNYDKLQASIWNKLFTLPDETEVFPGHGPKTSIGFEKINNPFVAIGM